MHKYPKVNYIGNKEKIVDWIIEELPLKRGIVVDLFSGGGAVSYALKTEGYEVISNDILYSNYVIAKALIENDDQEITEDVFKWNIEKKHLNEVRKKIDFMSNKLYFENEVDELARLICISEKLMGEEKYLFLALLRRAMIRKLPYSRMNVPWNQIKILRDEEYSYSKYRRRRSYHNQSFMSHMLENMKDYNNAVFKGKKVQVYRKDALTLIQDLDHVDIIYMDPPYPSTMNNYDAFYGAFDKMLDKNKEHTDFTCKKGFLENLELVVKESVKKAKYVILSQNTKVRPSPCEIEKMMHQYGKISIREKSHKYKVTSKENKNSSKELLFILETNRTN